MGKSNAQDGIEDLQVFIDPSLDTSMGDESHDDDVDQHYGGLLQHQLDLLSGHRATSDGRQLQLTGARSTSPGSPSSSISPEDLLDEQIRQAQAQNLHQQGAEEGEEEYDEDEDDDGALELAVVGALDLQMVLNDQILRESAAALEAAEAQQDEDQAESVEADPMPVEAARADEEMSEGQ